MKTIYDIANKHIDEINLKGYTSTETLKYEYVFDRDFPEIILPDKLIRKHLPKRYFILVFIYIRENNNWSFSHIEGEKTRYEIEFLKKNWEEDPCWDLYSTEGFELYKEELQNYQKGKEELWNYDYKTKISNTAKKLNCSEELAEYITNLEDRIDTLKRKVNHLYDL